VDFVQYNICDQPEQKRPETISETSVQPDTLSMSSTDFGSPRSGGRLL
jgi:hypothetical protein